MVLLFLFFCCCSFLSCFLVCLCFCFFVVALFSLAFLFVSAFVFMPVSVYLSVCLSFCLQLHFSFFYPSDLYFLISFLPPPFRSIIFLVLLKKILSYFSVYHIFFLLFHSSCLSYLALFAHLVLPISNSLHLHHVVMEPDTETPSMEN